VTSILPPLTQKLGGLFRRKEVMEEKTYVPFLNCGWKLSDDGCCSHPENATPECHQFICPIKVAQPSVQSDS
jgi:hypothetical protein